MTYCSLIEATRASDAFAAAASSFVNADRSWWLRRSTSDDRVAERTECIRYRSLWYVDQLVHSKALHVTKVNSTCKLKNRTRFCARSDRYRINYSRSTNFLEMNASWGLVSGSVAAGSQAVTNSSKFAISKITLTSLFNSIISRS
jgi:hypothetical protein